jgi:hypothetical protein
MSKSFLYADVLSHLRTSHAQGGRSLVKKKEKKKCLRVNESKGIVEGSTRGNSNQAHAKVTLFSTSFVGVGVVGLRERREGWEKKEQQIQPKKHLATQPSTKKKKIGLRQSEFSSFQCTTGS